MVAKAFTLVLVLPFFNLMIPAPSYGSDCREGTQSLAVEAILTRVPAVIDGYFAQYGLLFRCKMKTSNIVKKYNSWNGRWIVKDGVTLDTSSSLIFGIDHPVTPWTDEYQTTMHRCTNDSRGFDGGNKNPWNLKVSSSSVTFNIGTNRGKFSYVDRGPVKSVLWFTSQYNYPPHSGADGFECLSGPCIDTCKGMISDSEIYHCVVRCKLSAVE